MCLVRERQIEVTRITVVQKVLYAEAVKRVVEEDGSRVKDPESISVIRPRSIESDRNNMLQKGCFVFMAMVVNCTTVIECKTEWIDVVVAAVEKYLGVQYFTAELQGVLKDNILSS